MEASEKETAPAPVRIKKYANRRLYNTATSSYVTLDHLCKMVKEGKEFVVHDAKTGEEITRQVLTQIIVEEEGKGQNMLPVGFLRQLISFYGDNLQALLPRYLETTMASFARNQEQMRHYLHGTLGNLFPFGTQIEEMAKQNMALFENAMKMFTPFNVPGAGRSGGEARSEDERGGGPSGIDIEQLKTQLEAMQKRLDDMAKKKD